jgi:hypothetical protein
MEPEDEVDHWLGPPNENETRPDSMRATNEGSEHHPELVKAYGLCVYQSALLYSDRLYSSPNTVPILRAIVTRSPTGSTLFLLDTASTIGTRSIRLPFSATMDP